MVIRIVTFLFVSSLAAMGALPDRVTRPVDPGRVVSISGNVHRLAQPQFDRGAADPGMAMDYMVVLVKPSTAQQTDLDQLLADQQNPSSAHFREWLTPEAFGNRFGLSPGDQSKVVAWLVASGFNVNHLARGRNWIAFSGSAAQVTAALHTPIHRFQVDGETHFANTSDPAVPEALSDVVGGFLGLNDFRLHSFLQPAQPENTSGTTHYLVPADFATIYDLNPLYQAGVDGTGQSIAVVGQSDVSITDLRAFRTRYNLPPNDPKMLNYSTTDPGFTSSQIEGDLDLEWAGAIAPQATIYYVYGPSAFTAIVAAIELDVAPVITISYGTCEIDFAPSVYRSIAQQANAQGITILAASGDSGAAGCDTQGAEPFATRGLAATFPSALPEVTGVGGTEFVEGTGNYWASTNAANFSSALSYIPEMVWNESGTVGLLAGGGGASLLYPKPAWQSGPGVPSDTSRHVPDVALSAAGHDAYYIYYSGVNLPVSGTSASAPSMAGTVALLNHYLVSNKVVKVPGLGNINPQLYRLAQTQPAVFHDITAGNNIVPCAEATPNCAAGSFGYPAGPGYDMGAGLGSVDANALATAWNTAASGVTVTLSVSPITATLNDTAQLTAVVTAANGTPTGSVSFEFDTVALGTVPLTNGSASLTVPLYQLGGTGIATLSAEYSGDASFSSGGATRLIKITVPTGAAAILPSVPNTVYPAPPDAQGLSWQTAIGLFEEAGIPAILTGFTIDGQAQTLSTYFPSPSIPANGSLTTTVVFRGLAAPLTRTFGFTGVDAMGNSWSRQVSTTYLPLPTDNFFGLTATPLTIQQNTAADPACQWAVQLNVDDLGGFGVNLITTVVAGRVGLSAAQIASTFGSTRLDAWSDQHGTLCFSGITPPASDAINVGLSDGASYNLAVSFTGPSPAPVALSATPASVSIAAASASQPAQATLAVNLPAPTQQWTAAVYPANRTTSWLSLSSLSGTGSSQITLAANGTGFEPGVYRATIVIQSANSVPQFINVPVMLVLGGSTSGTAITSVANPASDYATVSPGMLLNVLGSNLAAATKTASGNPLPFSTGGVSATVNGLAAPVVSTSPTMLTIQVPYEVGAGPAVLGVNNNGQIAGYQIQIAASSPGIFADSSGNVLPSSTVAQGGLTTLYLTGAGDVTPALKTAYEGPPVTSVTPASTLPKPVLPLSVTVGGVPAFVQFAGIPPGLIGTIQVNLIVPASVPVGSQPVVVTVGGVSSPAVNLTVNAVALSVPVPNGPGGPH